MSLAAVGAVVFVEAVGGARVVLEGALAMLLGLLLLGVLLRRSEPWSIWASVTSNAMAGKSVLAKTDSRGERRILIAMWWNI